MPALSTRRLVLSLGSLPSAAVAPLPAEQRTLEARLQARTNPLLSKNTRGQLDSLVLSQPQQIPKRRRPPPTCYPICWALSGRTRYFFAFAALCSKRTCCDCSLFGDGDVLRIVNASRLFSTSIVTPSSTTLPAAAASSLFLAAASSSNSWWMTAPSSWWLFVAANSASVGAMTSVRTRWLTRRSRRS